MSKALEFNKLRAPMAGRALVFAMMLSVAAFGCTTNHMQTAGEPVHSAPAAGSVIPSVSSTPGTAGPSIPTTMISSAVDAGVDAIAVLEANRSFQGRVLGLAAPGTGAPSLSMQFPTGQLVNPSLQVNPQLTVNSSISSSPVPAISSGAGEGVGAAPVFVEGATIPGMALVGPTSAGVVSNFGVTGQSNTTATGLASVTSPASTVTTATTPIISTGVAAAPARSGNVLATPVLASTSGLSVVNTALILGAPLTTSTSGALRMPATTRFGSNINVINSGGRIRISNLGNQ